MNRFSLVLIISVAFSCGRTGTSQNKSLFDDPDVRLVNSELLVSHSVEHVLGALVKVFPETGELEEMAFATCSAVKLTADLILTANHCTGDDRIFHWNWFAADPDKGQLVYKTIGSMVRLFFEGEMGATARDYSSYPLLRTKLVADERHDIAIWQLSSSAPAPFLDIENLATNSKKLSLLAYPNGVPLSVSDNCIGTMINERIYHTCDSLSGSSGGLLLAEGKPVAVHQKGAGHNSADFYKDRGKFESVEHFKEKSSCLQTDSSSEKECEQRIGMNRATSLDFVFNLIRDEYPQLYARITKRVVK